MDADIRAQIVEEIRQALEGGSLVVTATVTNGGEAGLAQAGEKLLVRRDGSRLGTLGSAALDDADAYYRAHLTGR